MPSPTRPESEKPFEVLLAESGCKITAISEWPKDLDASERIKEGTPLQKIDIPGIGSYLIVKYGNDSYVGQIYFGKKEGGGSSWANNLQKLYPQVLDTINANLKGEVVRKEGERKLDALIAKLNGIKTEITAFPSDLDDSQDRLGYGISKDFDGESSLYRIDFPNGTTIIVLKPQKTDFYVGVYKNGKYYAGNHDMTTSELEDCITKH